MEGNAQENKINVEESKRKLIAMTPTATELWNDKGFIEKRMEEQHDYIVLLSSEQRSDRCTRSKERYDELVEAADFQYKRFRKKLKELHSALV